MRDCGYFLKNFFAAKYGPPRGEKSQKIAKILIICDFFADATSACIFPRLLILELSLMNLIKPENNVG